MKVSIVSLVTLGVLALLACTSAPAPAQPASQPTVQPTSTQIPPTSTPTQVPPTPTQAPPTPTQTPEPTSTVAASGAAVPTTSAPSPAPPTPTSTATPVPPTATATATPEPASDVAVTLIQGTVARYLVQEQLAVLDFPNDVIGETTMVSGGITFSPDGQVRPEASLITVNVASMRTDSEDRDEFLRDNSLETAKFPDTTLVVKHAVGLPWPLPSEGEATFQLIGDLTIKDVAREVIWEATARFNNDIVFGQAKTQFTFDDINMKKPKIFVVLSVDDDIRLEMDFVATVGER